jgi:hypothetical protein
MRTARMFFSEEEIVKECNKYLLKVSVNGATPWTTCGSERNRREASLSVLLCFPPFSMCRQ